MSEPLLHHTPGETPSEEFQEHGTQRKLNAKNGI